MKQGEEDGQAVVRESLTAEVGFEQRLEGRGRDRIDIRGIRVLGLGNTQCKGGVLACSGKSEEVKVG